MAKPSISTSMSGAKRKRKNVDLAQRLAGGGKPTQAKFQSVYNAPQTIRATPTPDKKQLGQARAKRGKFSDALLAGGGRKQLFKAYGKGFEKGDLAAALTTLRTARRKVQAGEAPPELLTSDLVTRAQRQSQDWLQTRKKFLSGKYMNA